MIFRRSKLKKKNQKHLIQKLTAFILFLLVFIEQSKSVCAEDGEIDLPSTDHIHGIYVSAYVAGTKNMMDEIIQNIDDSSINAIVIDVNLGAIYI